MQHRLQILQQGAVTGTGILGWLESIAAGIPTQAIQAVPYVLTIIVIAGFIGRSTPPAADGIPYEKESE
jgi:simple sugar transport system permease protein